MGPALAELIGKTLQSIHADPPLNQPCIQFSDGLRISIRPNLTEYHPTDDLLLVYPRGRDPIGYRVDLGFYSGEE
jgi:hypothetical protein